MWHYVWYCEYVWQWWDNIQTEEMLIYVIKDTIIGWYLWCYTINSGLNEITCSVFILVSTICTLTTLWVSKWLMVMYLILTAQEYHLPIVMLCHAVSCPEQALFCKPNASGLLNTTRVQWWHLNMAGLFWEMWGKFE